MTKSTLQCLVACVVFWTLCQTTALAQQLTFVAIADQPQLIRIAPGQTATLRFLVRNDSTSTSPESSTGITHWSAAAVFEQYLFTSLSPAVCSDVFDQFGKAAFLVRPLPAGAIEECQFEVKRKPTSRLDYELAIGFSGWTRIGWETSDGHPFYGYYYVGTLPELTATAVQLAPIQAGATSAEFRVTVANHGPIDIDEPWLDSGCSPDFDTPGDRLQEVGDDSCIVSGGGQCPGWYQVGLRLPKTVPAGGFASCTVRMTFPPIQSTRGFWLNFYQWQSAPNGNWGFIIPQEFSGGVGIFASPAPTPPVSIPSGSHRLLLLLGFALIWTASRKIRDLI